MTKNKKFLPKRGPRRNRFKRRNNHKLFFTGIRSMPAITPRTAQDAPWNSIVIQRTFSIENGANFTMSLLYVRDVLANQLGVQAGSNLTFRILALDLYDMAARPFELATYNFDTDSAGSATNSQISTAVAWPGRNFWPRVKFVWPETISTAPLSTASSTLATRVVTGAVAFPLGIVNVVNTSMLARFHLYWRITQVQTVPTITGDLSSQVQNPCSSVMKSLRNPDTVIDGQVTLNRDKPDLEQFANLGIHMDSSL